MYSFFFLTVSYSFFTVIVYVLFSY